MKISEVRIISLLGGVAQPASLPRATVTGTGDWEATAETDRLFVYHGRLLLMELDALNANAVIREYTWGLDLSNDSLDEAGGIGGLLACYDTNGTTSGADPTADDEEYIYFYDANGNVGQLIAWASGYGSAAGYAWHADRLVARYEYDAYGDIIGPDFDADGDWTDDAGPFAATNPFRFSTKYWDDETGLGYWGYRYYSPRLGRWISRDPIGEAGNINLFRYTYNNPIDAYDIAGLFGVGPSISQRYKHKACCKYENDYWGEYQQRSQRTIDCPCVIHPVACCKCSQSDMKGDGARFELLSAKKGPCCSCRVQLRRQTPYGWIRHISWITNEWPQHISAFVKCTNGDKYRMQHTRSGGPKIGSPQEGADEGRGVGLGNTAIVADYCVSCDSAGAVIQKAKALHGCEYGGIQDCHWFTDQLMRELKRSIVYSDDACPSISSRGHDGQAL